MVAAGASPAAAVAVVAVLVRTAVARARIAAAPDWAWVSVPAIVEVCGGVARHVSGSIDTDWKITPEQLEEAITERTIAVMINSPSNPCGTVYPPEELKALAEVLERHPGITLLSDEIYEKLIYPEIDPDVRHLSLGSLPELAERTITINGLSKAFAKEKLEMRAFIAQMATGEGKSIVISMLAIFMARPLDRAIFMMRPLAIPTPPLLISSHLTCTDLCWHRLETWKLVRALLWVKDWNLKDICFTEMMIRDYYRKLLQAL